MTSEHESMGNPSTGDRSSGGSQVKQGLETAKQKATDASKEARQRGKEKLEKGKEAAAEQVQQLAGAVGDVAGRLQNDTLAGYASDLGQRISRFADGLQQRSVDELAEEARALARRNPTVFLLGSVALGVALSRFLKASARRQRAAAWQQSDKGRDSAFEYDTFRDQNRGF
jgi:hypothetical protein